MRSTSPGRRELVLDWVFLIGVLLKGIDGLVELVAGIAALAITPGQVSSLARAITAGELAEDPHDLIANLILRESQTLGAGALFIGGLYLAIHGAVKVAIVLALIRGSRRAYPWAIAVLTALLVLQVVDLGVSYSTGVLVLSIADAVIIWLTWREWRHGRTLRDVFRLRACRLRKA